MADKTEIAWCDSTFNPWEGCQKVGPGCDHCYAETRNARFGGGEAPNWGPGAPRRRTSASNWNKPRKWQREAAAFFAEHGRRRRAFCASLADVFDNAVPAEWREDLFTLIAETPDLDWLLLTKRIGNVAGMLPADWGAGWPHVWLGATVVNQAEADRDVPKLLSTPAAVRFVSCEPLLGAIELREISSPVHEYGSIDALLGNHYRTPFSQGGWDKGPRLDWVIVGGESGPDARPMHPDWVPSLRGQCEATRTPFLFKQWGTYREFHYDAPEPIAGFVAHDGRLFFQHADIPPDVMTHAVVRLDKKTAGRTLDGVEHLAWPESPAGRAV